MRSIDLLVMLARERLAKGEDWTAYLFERKGGRDDREFMFVTGSVCKVALKTGPRKGRPNRSKSEPGTTATAILTDGELREFERKWEEKTGKCSSCVGEGTALAAWSATEGEQRRPCPLCQGTGKSFGARLADSMGVEP